MPDRSTPSLRRFLLFAVLAADCSSGGNTTTGPIPGHRHRHQPHQRVDRAGWNGDDCSHRHWIGRIHGRRLEQSGIAGSVTTANIDLAVGAAVVAASYTPTITASGTGVTSVSTSYALTVTAASIGGYTIAASPTAVSLAQGASGNTTITLTRTGGFRTTPSGNGACCAARR